MYILDTYAWIEYFLGTEKGKKVQNLIINKENRLITLDCNIAEFYEWCQRNKENFDNLFKVIKANCLVKSLTLANCIFAAKIKIEQRKHSEDFGLMDALLISKQKELNAKIVTGDEHFKSLKNIVYL